ncbi:helix-turn-helix domain-containing protein [Rhodococcus sp. IEGM 1370]|uniref:helix-turn-helix transcriptional regulator n=1 Tax=Rhodococcus sp. IEGM 1370 TaxID=3082222 RepID=UPI0029531233|nr:helix-turn-helix domain-containing protein [Rhodococcus sp. IEGM 1370]MDV8079755.1 helix-turn-helix domain-containing protein [Rhodococcus sp. IEGM 1370]
MRLADAMTCEELRKLPSVIGVAEAGRALGMTRQTSYNMVKAGEFPVPVHKLGGRYKVPTHPLLRFLGVETDHGVHTPAATSSGEPPLRRAIRTHTKSGKPIDPSKYYRIDGERVLGADLIKGTC